MTGIKHLSVSSIQDYLTCPLLWHGRRIAKWPQQPSAPMQIGIAIHAALSVHHTGGDAEVALVKRWSSTVTHPAGMRQLEAALGAVNAYCAVADVTPNDQPDWRFRFLIPGIPVPVIGFLDVKRPGAIKEFKTTAKPASWTQKRVDEEFQATVYAIAYRDQDKSVNPAIEYTVLGIGPEPTIQTYTTTRTDTDMLKARMLIRGVYEAMCSERLEPRCEPNRCQFPDQCAAYGLVAKPKANTGPTFTIGGPALDHLLDATERPNARRMEPGEDPWLA